MRHRLGMIGISATPHTAEVIEFFVFRDWPVLLFIGVAVS